MQKPENSTLAKDDERALLVVAHPFPSSLTHTVAAEISRALKAQGTDTEIADLAAEQFNPVFGPADYAEFATGAGLPVDVLNEQKRIDKTDHLILIFPVYWWAMPALLKGWIDRVFVSGWAFDEADDGRIVQRLGRLKISLVAIAGAKGETYAKYGYSEAIRVQIETGIFDFCGATIAASRLITPENLKDDSAVRTVAEIIAASIKSE